MFGISLISLFSASFGLARSSLSNFLARSIGLSASKEKTYRKLAA
jgi:hypothetical protein